MIFCGIPVFFQEVAIGQYLGSGGMTLVAQLCPLLKGVGIATMCLVFFLDIYYCVIIAWTFFYMIATFTAIPELPWDTCGKWFKNSEIDKSARFFHMIYWCLDLFTNSKAVFYHFYYTDGWWNTEYCYRATDNMTENDAMIKNHSKISQHHGENKTTTPVEEFWE